MLRYVLFDFGGLFDDESDRGISEEGLLWLLESLCQWNQRYLKAHPETPPLYQSGVVYKKPEQLSGDGFLSGEHFRDVPAVIENGGGDCFPLSQKIIVRSRSTGQYELLQIGDLRHVYPAYEALSYSFSKQEYEFKPVVGFVDKGMKLVSLAHLSNGTDVVATDDHKFWTLDHVPGRPRVELTLGVRTMGEYVETYLDQQRGKISRDERSARNKILIAAKIPALGVVRPPAAEAYLAGIYAAEGSFDGKHTCIAQHKPEIRAKIEARLAETGTSFRYREPVDRYGGGAYYALHGGAKNPVVAMMREQGEDSFSKRVPQRFLSGDEATVARVLEGHGDGDAWHPQASTTYRFPRPQLDAIYVTSSDELMEQLRLGALVLGRRTYAYPGDNRGKVIWRLHEYNDRSSRLVARGERVSEVCRGLTYGTVRRAMPLGKAHVGCVEVADNHNFFLADGTLASNCDNVSCWRVAELRNAGYRGVGPYITSRSRDEGGRTYHALVRWPWPKPKGSTEDPSLILGMGGDARAADREAELQKNLERVQERQKAVVLGARAGRIPPRVAEAMLRQKPRGPRW